MVELSKEQLKKLEDYKKSRKIFYEKAASEKKLKEELAKVDGSFIPKQSFIDKVKNIFFKKEDKTISVTDIATQEILNDYKAKKSAELKTTLTVKKIEEEKARIDAEIKRSLLTKKEKINIANTKITSGIGKIVKAIVGDNSNKPVKKKSTPAEKLKKIENFNKNIEAFGNSLIGGGSSKRTNFDDFLGEKNNSKPINFGKFLDEKPGKKAKNDIFANLMDYEKKGRV